METGRIWKKYYPHFFILKHLTHSQNQLHREKTEKQTGLRLPGKWFNRYGSGYILKTRF